jgi:hypothetical protein
MKEILESRSQHETTLAALLAAVKAHGGDMDTPLLIEADGEPVYIMAAVPPTA